MGDWLRRTRGFGEIAIIVAAMAVLLPSTAGAGTTSAIAPVPPQPARSDAPLPAPPSTPPPPASVEEVVVSAPEPRYVAPTTRDRIGRIWAPVLINGKGPYRLVLDTGASRSAITSRVAERLGVPITADAVRLRGVTGSNRLRGEGGHARVRRAAGRETRLPIVADAFGGADGVFGGEGLRDKRIVIEFRNDRISIARSHREPARPGYSVVPFRHSPQRGMRVDAWSAGSRQSP